jgi:hypothetical protein
MYQCGTLEKALGTLLLCALEAQEDGVCDFMTLSEAGMRAGFSQAQVNDAVNSLANVAFVHLLVSPDNQARVIVRRNPEKPLEVYAGKPAMQFG